MTSKKTAKTDQQIYFIGIGGVGMSPMAILMKEKGFAVSGSDIAESANTIILSRRGVKVHIGEHNAANLPPDSDAPVVVSSAIDAKNPELLRAKKLGLKIFRRGEFLAKIAKTYKKTIAIGGSHGKTTITSMTVHILKTLGFHPGYVIGGKVSGWKYSGAAGDGTVFITESDESDGSNVHISSDTAVVCNVDDDHVWNFESGEVLLQNFAKFANRSAALIYGLGNDAEKIFSFHGNAKSFEIGDADNLPAKFAKWPPFQRLNAIFAVEAAVSTLPVSREDAVEAVYSFPGVERRMSVRYDDGDFTLIEDYAHHPAELNALVESLIKIKGERKLHIIFQPHRYARLKKYFDRFVCELRKADKVTILPVFSAWRPDEDIDSEKLAKEINRAKGRRDFANFAPDSFELLACKIVSEGLKNKIIAVVGAGDCDKLIMKIKIPIGISQNSLAVENDKR
jgi:UDP-N-acetylmuramate--alanine ligase